MGHKLTEHKIVPIEPWVEFECAKCGIDMDFTGADMEDAKHLKDAQQQFDCPNCGHLDFFDG